MVKTVKGKNDVSLKRCLKNQLPELSENIIDSFVEFVDRYDLNWFSDSEVPGIPGVHFLVSELTKIEGMHSRSLIRSWERYCKRTAIVNAPIPPMYYQLKGNRIAKLKRNQPHLGIDSYCNNLNICNWTLIYAFKIDPTFHRSADKRTIIPHLGEERIQEELLKLSAYTHNTFNMEYMVVDTLSPTVNTRRFDLVRKVDKEINVYELKSFPLNYTEVARTIAEKAYQELAQANFNSKINFFFVAPSIDKEASRLLRSLKINFISVTDLALQLKEEILEVNPNQGKWFYESLVWEKFAILPQEGGRSNGKYNKPKYYSNSTSNSTSNSSPSPVLRVKKNLRAMPSY